MKTVKKPSKTQILRALKIFAGLGTPMMLAAGVVFFRELMIQSIELKGVFSGLALVCIVSDVVFCVVAAPRLLSR